MRSVLNKSGQTLFKTLHQESEILPCQNLEHGVLGRQFDNSLISHQFIPNTTTTTTIRLRLLPPLLQLRLLLQLVLLLQLLLEQG